VPDEDTAFSGDEERRAIGMSTSDLIDRWRFRSALAKTERQD